MNITDEAVALIKEFEGCRLEAYVDSVGVWTIGYGHSDRAPVGPGVHAGMTITQKQAESILRADLEHFAKKIRPLFRVPVGDNVFGACLSLAFNIGTGSFADSTCLRRINGGDLPGAAEALQWFDKAGGKVLAGLQRRRAAEAAFMLKPQQPKHWLALVIDILADLFGGKK